MNSAESANIYGEFYSSKLDNAMNAMKEFYKEPLNRRAFFEGEVYGDQSVESMLESLGGSSNLGGARIYSALGGDPIDLGDKMIMSQFYR